MRQSPCRCGKEATQGLMEWRTKPHSDDDGESEARLEVWVSTAGCKTADLMAGEIEVDLKIDSIDEISSGCRRRQARNRCKHIVARRAWAVDIPLRRGVDLKPEECEGA